MSTYSQILWIFCDVVYASTAKMVYSAFLEGDFCPETSFGPLRTLNEVASQLDHD